MKDRRLEVYVERREEGCVVAVENVIEVGM